MVRTRSGSSDPLNPASRGRPLKRRAKETYNIATDPENDGIITPSVGTVMIPSISDAASSETSGPNTPIIAGLTNLSASFTNLKLAASLIPKCDGCLTILFSFIDQARTAEARINPIEKQNLLEIVKSKLEGQAA